MKTDELLVQICQAHDKSGGAIYQKPLDARMKKLEREGLVERHILGNGKLCARITEKGRTRVFVFCGNNF